MVWVELGWIGHLVGWVGVKVIGPMDNSKIEYVHYPYVPQRVAQKAICGFFRIKSNFNQIQSARKFLYVKTSSSKVVVQPFPYLMIY